jgi:hypothetical protein
VTRALPKGWHVVERTPAYLPASGIDRVEALVSEIEAVGSPGGGAA